MLSSCYSHALKKAVLVLTILLAAASASFAQTVALTATPQITTLPDGSTVPMWDGLRCREWRDLHCHERRTAVGRRHLATAADHCSCGRHPEYHALR